MSTTVWLMVENITRFMFTFYFFTTVVSSFGLSLQANTFSGQTEAFAICLSTVKIFRILCSTMCVHRKLFWGFFGPSLLFDAIFYVQHLCVQLYLLKQQQIKGRQNQNRARLNLSSRAFHMCTDKGASILVLTSHSSVILKNHATSLSVQTCDATMPLHHRYCCWTRPET